MKNKQKQSRRRRLDVNVQELDQIVDRAREAPLSDKDYDKLKTTLHALIEKLLGPAQTEKLDALFADENRPPSPAAPPRGQASAGHGRNGVQAFSGARKVAIAHQQLAGGERCPECGHGKVYRQKEPKALVRIVGQAPLAATIYELQRLRCNACGQVFTAQEPAGVGPEKYDETAAAMIAQLKYGSGVPFNRLERMEELLGIPLPAATQWEVVADAAELMKPARDELIHQAAQGEVLHNDGTSMRILRLEREPSDQRTGVFTSGIVATGAGKKIALYFTGRQHAGENLAEVIRRRAPALGAPIQMCDALSRNVPKLSEGVEILLANCLAHGRRQFVEVAQSFPQECRYVLETLGRVYYHDAQARQHKLSAQERLQFHQQHSAPVMEELHDWLQAQLAQNKTEPNSALGKAINYMLRHWRGLTVFLRQPGAPLDNNLCEQVLKRAVLHRKNALFYRTLNGAEVGDLCMSLIHTCELNHANSFQYLTELQRHAPQVAANPSRWMPWNYRDTLERCPVQAQCNE
jgi:ribosomal protein L15